MKRLIEMSRRKLIAIPPKFKSYLSGKIDWTQRLIVILGHRGTGKTTLMLQHMHESNVKSKEFQTLLLLQMALKVAQEVKFRFGYSAFYIREKTLGFLFDQIPVLISGSFGPMNYFIFKIM